MSIWSSFRTIEPVYSLGYGWEGQSACEPVPEGCVDLASASSWFSGLRIWVNGNGEEATVVLHPDQVTELRDALTSWLDTYPPENGAGAP